MNVQSRLPILNAGGIAAPRMCAAAKPTNTCPLWTEETDPMQPRTSSRIMRFLGIAMVVIVLFATALGIAGAQPASPNPPTPSGQQGGPRGAFGDRFVASLAANLGLPVDTVQSALQTTRQQLQAQMPNDGTQGQPRGGPGQPFGPGAPGGPRGMGGPFGSIGQETATILGMTPQDLQAELQQGKTLAQVAQEHGVSADALADQLTQQAVQTFQANESQLHDRIRQALDQPFPAPGTRPAPGQGPGPQPAPGATQS